MKIRDMVLCALFTALMCLCAWITVPISDIALTMQTFALFLTLGLLGGKRGSIVCLVYLLLGAVGLPVFSGFRGGLGALLGATGGYLWGFAVAALIYWLFTALWGESLPVRLLAFGIGLLALYAAGTVWFLHIYAQNSAPLGIAAVIVKCVLPYILPDFIKLAVALPLIRKLKPFVTY